MPSKTIFSGRPGQLLSFGAFKGKVQYLYAYCLLLQGRYSLCSKSKGDWVTWHYITAKFVACRFSRITGKVHGLTSESTSVISVIVTFKFFLEVFCVKLCFYCLSHCLNHCWRIQRLTNMLFKMWRKVCRGESAVQCIVQANYMLGLHYHLLILSSALFQKKWKILSPFRTLKRLRLKSVHRTVHQAPVCTYLFKEVVNWLES